MKNNNTAFSLSGRTKLFLFICLSAIAAIDLTAFVYLIVTGVSVGYWILPLLFLIADAIFILQSIFSNFRFKYAIGEIVFYFLMTGFALAITVLNAFAGDLTVYTSVAAIMWSSVHAIALLASLICYLYTAKRFLSNVVFQTIIAIITSVVCVLSAFVYIALTVDGGFFGQGTGIRPVVYEYDEENDCYSVTGVIEGKEESVVVPETFNGKPVKVVSASIFAAEGITGVTLNCAPDVTFSGINECNANAGLKVYAPRSTVDEFKEVFFQNSFNLANRMAPCGLEEDEVYITFNWDRYYNSQFNGKYLHTWIGKKGDKLDMSYFKDIPYATHSDASDDEDLYWNFENNDKMILTGISTGSSDNLLGKSITSDYDDAELYFSKICRVYTDNGNDDKYDLDDDFAYSSHAGVKLDYKFTVADNADSIINSIKREGFTAQWTAAEPHSEFEEIDSLKTAINKMTRGINDLTVRPEWKLVDPAITLEKNKETVVYGGDITLTAKVIPAIEGMQVDYAWSKSADGDTLCGDSEFLIENIDYGETGFILTAIVYGDNTSLTASVSKSIPVTVTKKPLEVEWTLPDNLVYEGADKSVSCGISGGIINGDDVFLPQTEFLHRNAGTYTDEVVLTGENCEKYYISAGQSKTVTISKADLTVNWLTENTVYNGESQSPEISVDGVYNDEVKYTLTSGVDVGSYNIEFTATEGGENYNIINPTSDFEITPYSLTAEWQCDKGEEFTYDGKQHAIIATAAGINGETLTLDTSISSIKNAGEYTVTATIADKNYSITSNDSKTYTIKKYSLTVVWGETELTYNASLQSPKSTMTGVGDDGDITGTIDGAERNAGENYTCEVTGVYKQNDHEVNYEVAYNASTSYSIKPAEVEVQWNAASTYTYNGKEQAPTAYIRGLGSDGTKNCSVTGGGINAGTYTAQATLDDKNYTLTNTSHLFTIGVRGVTITAQNFEMAYGDVLPEKFSYTFSQLAEGDEVAEVFTVNSFEVENKVEVNGYIKPGTYAINVNFQKNGAKASNYSVQVEKGTLTVKKKAIKVTIDDKEITFGDELPEFTYTAEGLVVSDTQIFKGLKLQEGEVTAAGDYTIVPDGYADGILDLYEIGVKYGALTVKEAQEVEDEV